MRDWRPTYATALVEGVDRQPVTLALQYRVVSEKPLREVLNYIGLPLVILTFRRRLPRRKGFVVRHWLPGYAFVSTDLETDRWQQVRRAPGVVGYLGDPSPQPIDEAVYAALLARCPDRPPKNDEFTVIPAGSEVEVLSGPLKGTVAVVSRSRGRSAWVEAFMFNQPMSVEVRTRDLRILR